MQFQFYTVAEVLPDMAEILDPLHKLRTGGQPKTKVHVITESVLQDILDTPSYSPKMHT